MPYNSLTADTLYRIVTVMTALIFCFAFVLGHIVRDDLALWQRTLSMYAVGPAGWVMTLGFYSIACTQMLIAFRLYQLRQSAGDLLAVALLVVAALGIVLVAIFPYPIKLPHNSGAALQLGLFPVFLVLRTVLHRKDALWKFTLTCAALSTAFFLLLIWNGQTDYDRGSVGMAQKAQIMVNTLWLVVFSWRLPEYSVENVLTGKNTGH